MMESSSEPGLAEGIAAAMAWWREAGVDCDFRDVPANWIALPASRPDAREVMPPKVGSGIASPSPPRPRIGDIGLPQDLASFHAWWLGEPLLDSGRVAGRVPPRGPQGAEIMAIVPEPEREDSDRLLSGPQGRLLDAMLAAMAIAPGDAYVASALPRHTPSPDWAAATEAGLGDVLAHHLSLARPKRIIVFGGNILPLFGNRLPISSEVLRKFNHEDLSIPLLAATELPVLLARAPARARLWRLWLDWTGTDPT